MSSRTSPHDNISPADTPPRPSRASPAPPIDLGARGIAEIALPPTLHQEKNNPFPIDAAHCEDYPQDPTSPHDTISPGGRPRPPSIWERGASLTCWLSHPPPTIKKNLFLSMLLRCDGKEECPDDATIPRNNGSPGDTPPRPSRAPTVSARDVEVQGIANMALHPTPNNQQETLFPIDAARFPIDERRID